MKYASYSHNNGGSIVPQGHHEEVISAISSASMRLKKGDANRARDSILKKLISDGWSAECTISTLSKITITSAKNQVGLCIQTGNIARMYADLLKLQTLYVSGGINSAIMIVPSKNAARTLGSNIANSKRIETELSIFGTVITVPMTLYSFE